MTTKKATSESPALKAKAVPKNTLPPPSVQPPIDNDHVAAGSSLFKPIRLHGHEVNSLNQALVINALDAPGSGGASHEYEIRLVVPSQSPELPSEDRVLARIGFQNGPVKASGFNGITHEALLEILIHRLQGFQRGQFANEDNKKALNYIEAAKSALHRRTMNRMNRGVEGSHTP